MLKKSVEREVTGDEKTDIVSMMESEIRRIVFGSMPTVFWNVTKANQAYPAMNFGELCIHVHFHQRGGPMFVYIDSA